MKYCLILFDSFGSIVFRSGIRPYKGFLRMGNDLASEMLCHCDANEGGAWFIHDDGHVEILLHYFRHEILGHEE